MNKDEILAKLECIIQDTLDLPDVKLTNATAASDVEGWDSLAHIKVLIEVEAAFNVRFTANEIAGIKDIGFFVNLIASKQDA